MGNFFGKKETWEEEIARWEAEVVPEDLQGTIEAPVTLIGMRDSFHLKMLQLDKDVLEYFQNIDIFNCKESELEKNGFYKCVDNRLLKKHVYYEGYFHGLSCSSESLESRNPRTFESMQKPCIPLPFRAFLECFREINNFKDLLDLLPADSGYRKMIKDGFLFADLACQIHYGTPITAENVNWHIDAPNSILHLATAIYGKRGLHFEHEFPDDLDEMERPKRKKEFFWNEPGDVYLSSPHVFRHGVEYTRTKDYDDRIMAIQARFLIKEYPEEDRKTVTTAVKNWLESKDIRLPNLTEIKDKEQELINSEATN